MGQNLKRERVRFTANGTQTVNIGFAASKVTMTAYGEGGTPTAWDVDVDGRPWSGDGATAVELDGLNHGSEALGVTVHKDVTGIVTALDVVLASLNLDDADALIVDLVILGHA